MQQRSEAWFQARAGRITGSRFSRAMAAKSSDTYQRLISELVEERRTGRSYDRGYTNAAMQWGIDHESSARAWYSRQHGRQVQEVGFVVHPVHAFVGVSPDGLVGQDGLVEIKCPQLANFQRVVASRQMPSRYRWQVQGQLWVCGRQWLDFVCFYPPGRGVVVHVEADDADFDRIESRCIEIDREVTRRAGIGARAMPRPSCPQAPLPSPVSRGSANPPPARTSGRPGVPAWVWVVLVLVVLYWLAN